jgi:hypothetical protein
MAKSSSWRLHTPRKHMSSAPSISSAHQGLTLDWYIRELLAANPFASPGCTSRVKTSHFPCQDIALTPRSHSQRH